ncbi:MAG: DUF1570 domain-containing protein [Thermoguttaceae bacterium]
MLIACSAVSMLIGSNCPAAEEEQQRAAQSLQAKYADDLKQLAVWCEEKGLKEQARQTLAVLGPHDPLKFYLPVLPVDTGPAKLPEDASKDVVEWNSRLNKLRSDQAAALYDLARHAMRTHHAGLAMDLVLEAIRANPDNESLRRLLGYQKYQNQWHTIYEVKKLHSGMVWNDKFGWLLKSQVRRYEDGNRYFDGKWITAAEDARRHGEIDSGWVIETEHYSIRTNHGIEAGVALGLKLEDLYRLWEQMFIRYFASEADVTALFEGRARIQHAAPIQLKVVCFRDHEEYIRTLQPAMPNIGISVGLYFDSTRTAYFFAGKDSDDRTIYHEATHQLFHESRKVAPNVGQNGNFWVIEGIAMYMESLKKEDGYYVLGGFDDQRMVAARYRLLHDGFYVPLEQLTGYGMEKLQNDPKIATLYSQSAGLTNFLIHYDHGRYRDALVSYLTAIYTGRDGPDTLAQLTGTDYGELDKQYRLYMEQAGK